MTPDALVIIPARMSASRLPGKPLIKISGIELLKRCYQNASLAVDASNVYVAGCDLETEQFCLENKLNYLKTENDIDRAIDRVAEAVRLNPGILSSRSQVIVMLQGDEPFISADVIRETVKAFFSKNLPVVNLVSRTSDMNLISSTSVVKATISKNNQLIYLSRFPIVAHDEEGQSVGYIQTGLILFSQSSLSQFSMIREGCYERSESIDINRFLESGVTVGVHTVDEVFISIDTPKDVVDAEEFLKERHA